MPQNVTECATECDIVMLLRVPLKHCIRDCDLSVHKIAEICVTNSPDVRLTGYALCMPGAGSQVMGIAE